MNNAKLLWTSSGLLYLIWGIAANDATRTLTGVVALGVAALLPGDGQ